MAKQLSGYIVSVRLKDQHCKILCTSCLRDSGNCAALMHYLIIKILIVVNKTLKIYVTSGQNNLIEIFTRRPTKINLVDQ